MIKLYQFPISHYCEKARWALDYKNIEYQKVNLIPGLHLKTSKKLAIKSSVPYIQHNEKIICGSSQIIDYLEQISSDNLLTPMDGDLKKQSEEWEQFLDAEVGINVRLCAYYILLKYPNIVKPFFTHAGPWYGPLFVSFAFKKLRSKMRNLMGINQQSFQQSKKVLHQAIDKLASHYAQNEFLVGDSFSRADLSAASLLAPIMMPEGYGLNWPKDVPAEYLEFKQEFSEKLSWLPRIYQSYR